MKPCEPRCSLSQDAVTVTPLNIQEIRIAVHSGDARRLVEVLGGSIWTEILQLAGDALAGAAAQGVPGASELAEAWTTALRNRRSPEDDELAAELDAALGRRPPPPGQPLPVDLEELPDLLETRLGEEGGRVDLLTGEVWRPRLSSTSATRSPTTPPTSRTAAAGCTWVPKALRRATVTWRTSSPTWRTRSRRPARRRHRGARRVRTLQGHHLQLARGRGTLVPVLRRASPGSCTPVADRRGIPSDAGRW